MTGPDILHARLLARLDSAEALERRTDEALIEATKRSTEAKRLVVAALTALRDYRATVAEIEAVRAETREVTRQRDAARLSSAFRAAGEA